MIVPFCHHTLMELTEKDIKKLNVKKYEIKFQLLTFNIAFYQFGFDIFLMSTISTNHTEPVPVTLRSSREIKLMKINFHKTNSSRYFDNVTAQSSCPHYSRKFFILTKYFEMCLINN